MVLVVGVGICNVFSFRFDEPTALVALQKQVQDPILQWAQQRLGAPIVLTSGLARPIQSQTVVEKYSEIVNGLDSWRIVALECASWASKSVLSS